MYYILEYVVDTHRLVKQHTRREICDDEKELKRKVIEMSRSQFVRDMVVIELEETRRYKPTVQVTI